MYDKASVFNSVNETRKLLFTRKSRSIETIPPTFAALSEHAKRSIFQAGFNWRQSLEQAPSIPSPSEWGWQKGESGTWEPFLSRLPQASACCQELLWCKCKPETGCRGWCKCVRADMVWHSTLSMWRQLWLSLKISILKCALKCILLTL